jgi:hypothetical protein
LGRNLLPARSERGVAALEAGLVTTFLMPLLLGVLYFGAYFWHAQQGEVYAPRLPSGSYAGQTLTCQSLLSAVESDVVAAVNAANDTSAPDIDLSNVTAAVTEVFPDGGAVVEVTISVPVAPAMGSFLPNDGNLVTETTMRLDDVVVTDGICR